MGLKALGGRFGLIVFCACAWPGLAYALDLSKPIEKIVIEGAKRADQNTIRFYIHSKTGEQYSQQTAQEDIRRIYELGFFDDIQLDAKETSTGIILKFVFKEKPFVRDIIFAGVESINEDLIRAKVKTKKGTFFRQDFIPWDESRIQQTYRGKGYYFTGVKTVVYELGNNQVDVEYNVTEGKKIVVGKVNFRGNDTFADHILTNKIETQSAGWAVGLASGSYKKDALKTDILRLESFYHDNGYIKVKIDDPEVEIDKEKLRINVSFPLTEGERFYFGDMDIEGDEVFSTEELLEHVQLKKGDVFSRSVFREDIFRISDLYSQKGYAFASVTPDIDIDEKSKIVNAKIDLQKGPKVYVGKITISGNDKTRDRVIRRQFMLQEGELFNSENLRKSRQRINNLGFFESVEFEQRSRRENDLVDIDVKVIERETGQFSLSAGYSSVENILFSGSVSWKNLMGRGQEFKASYEHSGRRDDFSLSFTEKALFDRQLSGGIDLYNKSFQFDDYSSDKQGGSIRVGRAFGENSWGRIGYKYEVSNVDLEVKTETVKVVDENGNVVKDADGNDKTEEKIIEPNIFLKSQEGRRVIGSIFPSITYDTRNDPYSPSAGRKLVLSTELAGVGGEENFYKIIGEYTEYHRIWEEFVGMFHAKIGRADGYSGEDLHLNERFFMGGPRSLRGFTFRDIGPQIINNNSKVAIGGEASLLFNVELQYRFTRYFRGFLFYDRGNVYGKFDELNNTTSKHYDLEDMRHSAGFGIHFFSALGPLSVSYGFKLDKREAESASEFHFSIGTGF